MLQIYKQANTSVVLKAELRVLQNIFVKLYGNISGVQKRAKERAEMYKSV